jgi:tyrosinase
MAQTRRRFLKVTGGAIAASTLFDVEKLFAGPTFIRKDVGGLTAGSSDLVSYGNAINAMKALPSTNPLSWAYQAAIHGTTLSGAHPAWNTCEHGTLEFLSWHRMYLYWFERIIRKKSGDANFALPFWNYESSSERFLPPPFRTPGTGLFVPDANRGSGWNGGTSFLPGTAVSTSGCLPQVPFTSFSSNLEGTPHAAVHNTFGSTGGWMGSISTAAQDPIFFLHHCNIDRLWNVWLAQGGGRSNPLGDTTWKTKKFLFFDENGNQVWMTGCDILRAQEQLGYVYQNEPPQVKEYCLKLPPWWWKYLYEVVIQWPPIKLPPGPDPGPIEIDIRQFRERLTKIAEDKNVGLVLQLNDVTADRQPNVFWAVYAGLGKGERAVPESRNYIGNLALFGGGVHAGEGHGSARAADFELPLNEAIRTALANGAGSLSLRFVARGAGSKEPRQYRNDAAVTIGKVAIAVRRPEQAKI